MCILAAELVQLYDDVFFPLECALSWPSKELLIIGLLVQLKVFENL